MAKSVNDLAERTDLYVRRFLPLTRLAPDAVEAILGRQAMALRLAKMLENAAPQLGGAEGGLVEGVGSYSRPQALRRQPEQTD
jgi:hypothetical protein